MKIEAREIRKYCNILLVIYAIAVVTFCLVAHEQIVKKAPSITEIGKQQTGYMEEIVDGMEIFQEITLENQIIDSISIKFATFDRDNTGKITAYLINKESGECINECTVDVSTVENGKSQILFEELNMSEDYFGEYYVEIVSSDCKVGNAVTVAIDEKSVDKPVIINGIERENTSVYVNVVGRDYNDMYFYFYIGFGILFIVLLLYSIYVCSCFKRGKSTYGSHFISIIIKYKFLMKQLVARDFSVKYKKSLLGVTWSLLNPLLTMTVQYLVFNNIFRFQIENYAVYLLTGIVFYNGMTETTTNGLYSIVGNSGLITKVYVPKYIYPVSKVLSASINTVLSFIPLVIVTLITGLPIKPAFLLLPICLFFQIIFEIGLSMILASGMVFFRDVQFLWSVFTMLWMYLTPVIYSAEQLPESLQRFMIYNPMYHYISFARTIIIDGVSPMPIQYAICAGFSVLFLIIGSLVFKKSQDKFILYI